MKQEDKELLLKDLCARLPYGVKITDGSNVIKANPLICIGVFVCDGKWKPYLRPQFHCVKLCPIIIDDMLTLDNESKMLDWLNKNMFDYRGLIEKGVALEAPEGMYKVEEK